MATTLTISMGVPLPPAPARCAATTASFLEYRASVCAVHAAAQTLKSKTECPMNSTIFCARTSRGKSGAKEEVKQRFMELILQLHPDECSDP